MDYEKKYNEALERAKELLLGNEHSNTIRSYFEHIFPELRESEDERIRKALILHLQALYSSEVVAPGISKEMAIAYLEKQKEYHIPWYDYQKSKEAGYTIVPNEEYEQLIKQKEQKQVNHNLTTWHRDVVYSAMCDKNLDEGLRCNLEVVYKTIKELVDRTPVVEEQKPISQKDFDTAKHEALWEKQKPIQTENEREYVRTLKGLVSDFIRNSGGGIVDTAYYQQICDWLDGRHIEQKPNIELIQRSWYMEGYHDREFGKEPKWIIKTGEGGPRHELNPKYGQPLAKEQKLAEEKYQQELEATDRWQEGYEAGYNAASRPAWSEEDEKMLKWLCRIIHSRVVNKELSLAEESELGKWIDKWINHEPQHEKKWSEFDEDCLKRAVWYIENPAPQVVKDTNLVLWLKSLRPSWKPSEEQMDSLRDTIIQTKGYSYSMYLPELYEQLKKLGVKEEPEYYQHFDSDC